MLRHVVKKVKKSWTLGQKTNFQACFFFFSWNTILSSQRIQKLNKMKNAIFFSESSFGTPCIQGISDSWCHRQPRRLWNFLTFGWLYDMLTTCLRLSQLRSGETSVISQFCKQTWYNWIMYYPGTVEFPDAPFCLGKYLWPIINVRWAKTAKIIQKNGEVVYRSMYWPLTINDRADEQIQLDMQSF